MRPSFDWLLTDYLEERGEDEEDTKPYDVATLIEALEKEEAAER